MSAANARCSSGSTIALPPYLITTVAPWNRSSHGSASISVLALPSAIAEVAGRAGGHDEYAEFSCTYACDRSLVQIVAVVVARVQVDRDGARPARRGPPWTGPRRRRRPGTPRRR